MERSILTGPGAVLIISPTMDLLILLPVQMNKQRLFFFIFFLPTATAAAALLVFIRNSCMNIYVIVTLDCEFKMQNSQFAFVKSSVLPMRLRTFVILCERRR